MAVNRGKARVKAGTSRAAAAERRARFIEVYLMNGGNGRQAAIAVGFSKVAADSRARELLSEPRIKQIIADRRAELASKYKLTTERILQECARIAYADPRRLFGVDGNPIPIPELDDDTAAAVASFEHVEEFTGVGEARGTKGYTKKMKLWDKNSALEKAMKHLGLFKEDNAQRPVLPERVVLEFVEARKPK